MKPEARENLEAVLVHGAHIQDFVSGLDFDAYLLDTRTRFAVERSFEIIGEALNRTSKIEPHAMEALPEFRKIISFRNILAHSYDGIEEKIVWGIVEDALPELMLHVRELLTAST